MLLVSQKARIRGRLSVALNNEAILEANIAHLDVQAEVNARNDRTATLKFILRISDLNERIAYQAGQIKSCIRRNTNQANRVASYRGRDTAYQTINTALGQQNAGYRTTVAQLRRQMDLVKLEGNMAVLTGERLPQAIVQGLVERHSSNQATIPFRGSGTILNVQTSEFPPIEESVTIAKLERHIMMFLMGATYTRLDLVTLWDGIGNNHSVDERFLSLVTQFCDFPYTQEQSTLMKWVAVELACYTATTSMLAPMNATLQISHELSTAGTDPIQRLRNVAMINESATIHLGRTGSTHDIDVVQAFDKQTLDVWIVVCMSGDLRMLVRKIGEADAEVKGCRPVTQHCDSTYTDLNPNFTSQIMTSLRLYTVMELGGERGKERCHHAQTSFTTL